MASQQLFDPLALLRAAPLVTSTAALMFSHDQYLFLSSLVAPQHRARAEPIVPSYFRHFFPRGAVWIFTLYPLSIATGIANGWSRWAVTGGSWRWYAAGTGLAAAHFLFALKIVRPINAIYREESKGASTKDLSRWLDIHVARSLLADLPAWICFGIACLQSVQPL